MPRPLRVCEARQTQKPYSEEQSTGWLWHSRWWVVEVLINEPFHVQIVSTVVERQENSPGRVVHNYDQIAVGCGDYLE